jgi:hypothetical protein
VSKLILASILIATIAAPVLGAGDADPRRGLKRTLLFLLLFNVVWLAMLTLVYARFYEPELW